MTNDTDALSADDASPRAASAVLAMLGALVALPMLVVLLVMLLRDDAGGAAEDVARGVRDNRIQAVYMANDAVYFGNLKPGSGDWLELRDAFFLRSSAAAESRDGEEAAVTNLVPIQQQVGGDGTMHINSGEVVLVQNLAADSQIAREIEDAVQ